MKAIQEQNFNGKSDFISLREASRLYGFSHGYLKILIHRRKLEAFKKGRKWFTTKELLDKYLDSHPKIDAAHTSEIPKEKNQFALKSSEIDIFKKIAASFSSDIVKELQELRVAIKPPAVRNAESIVAYTDPVKINSGWNYFKTCAVKTLLRIN